MFLLPGFQNVCLLGRYNLQFIYCAFSVLLKIRLPGYLSYMLMSSSSTNPIKGRIFIALSFQRPLLSNICLPGLFYYSLFSASRGHQAHQVTRDHSGLVFARFLPQIFRYGNEGGLKQLRIKNGKFPCKCQFHTSTRSRDTNVGPANLNLKLAGSRFWPKNWPRQIFFFHG